MGICQESTRVGDGQESTRVGDGQESTGARRVLGFGMGICTCNATDRHKHISPLSIYKCPCPPWYLSAGYELRFSTGETGENGSPRKPTGILLFIGIFRGPPV